MTEVEPVEADPMSGDWSTPTYERSLNSGMNGRDEYESEGVSGFREKSSLSAFFLLTITSSPPSRSTG